MTFGELCLGEVCPGLDMSDMVLLMNDSPLPEFPMPKASGPGAAIYELMKRGFFDVPRTPAEVRHYWQSVTGQKYKAPEMSTTIKRMFKAGKLEKVNQRGMGYDYRISKMTAEKACPHCGQAAPHH